MKMKRARTLSIQTRIDARDLAVLIRAFPSNGEDSLSSVLRFYMESISSNLVRKGNPRPATIEEAIAQIEFCGFKLKQLDTTNPESTRTRKAIEKESLVDLLKDTPLEAPRKEEEELSSEEIASLEEDLRKIMKENE